MSANATLPAARCVPADTHAMTGMLASVASVAQASLALEAGVDIVDLLDPSRGTLGAPDPRVARAIVETVGTFAASSANIGDTPAMEPAQLAAAAQVTSRLGAKYVRIGFWGTPRDADCSRALSALAGRTRLVAVLFADLPQHPDLLDTLAQAGFCAVMFETAEKRGAPLRLLKSETELALFVRRVRSLGMLCGLAGKLRLADIAPLLDLQPDFLGFRSALCTGGRRTADFESASLHAVRAAIPNVAAPFAPGSGGTVPVSR